jgi:HPt (histidine-containing phosphotransfer) domain-containing protein
MPNDRSPEELLISELAAEADLADLIESFVAELPERAVALQQHLRAADYAAVASLAHQLKGAAGGYGFPSITTLAGEIERQARTQTDLDRLAGQIQEMIDLCGRARATPP